MMDPILPALKTYLTALVSHPSISPEDAHCQDYIAKILQNLGFRVDFFPSGKVQNLYAEWGEKGPLLVFAGHTDVVEPGPLSNWKTPPFELHEQEGYWFGRGVADMKGSIAAFMVAVDTFLQAPLPYGRIGCLLTSGEEGEAYLDGTPFVLKKLIAGGTRIDACIIGEPTAEKLSGDMIKNGRRGSISATGKILGQQGHVAYPALAQNALHMALPFLSTLSQLILDEGNEAFEASTLQITRIENFTKARNVIPGTVEFDFNIRFNTEHSSENIQQKIEELAKDMHLPIDWIWSVSGEPFITQNQAFLSICQKSIEKVCGQHPILSTSGGTSDARFIAPYGIPVLEIGLPNQRIHQPNESTQISEVHKLTEIYLEIFKQFFNA